MCIRDRFKEVQKQLDKESIMFDSEMTSYVLCHLRTDLQKRYNKIVSKWVKIDPVSYTHLCDKENS